MFLEYVMFGFVIALLRGGRLQADVGIKAMWLAPVAYGIQLVNTFWVTGPIQVLLTTVSYGALFYLAWSNRDRLSIRLLLIGMILNVLVIAVNGGRIPVDLAAAERLGIPVDELVGGVMAKHAALTPQSRLPFLGDVVPVPFPLARLISLGDIFAVAGMLLLIQEFMGKPVSFGSEGTRKADRTSTT